MIGDEPRRLQLGADLGDMSADIGMVGERLSIAFRPARVDYLAQFVECRLCYPEIDRRVRAPEPMQIALAQPAHIVRAQQDGAIRHKTFLEDQSVTARSAHPEDIPVWVDAPPAGSRRQ